MREKIPRARADGVGRKNRVRSEREACVGISTKECGKVPVGGGLGG
jgi:hypothetical protein